MLPRIKEKYGIDIPPSRVSAYNGYPDVAATQEQARPVIQKMKNAGVTSIIISADPAAAAQVMQNPFGPGMGGMPGGGMPGGMGMM